MTAADTNVLVRIVTNDEPDLAARAIDFFRQQEAVFIPKTVLLELEWVLRGGYRLPRQAVLAAIGAILRLPNVEIEDVEPRTRPSNGVRRASISPTLFTSRQPAEAAHSSPSTRACSAPRAGWQSRV